MRIVSKMYFLAIQGETFICKFNFFKMNKISDDGLHFFSGTAFLSLFLLVMLPFCVQLLKRQSLFITLTRNILFMGTIAFGFTN